MNLGLKILSWLAYQFVMLLYRTYRFRYYSTHEIEVPHKNQLLATWHQNLFPMLLSHRGLNYVGMVSKSKDGDIVAYTIVKLGYQVVRGSSRRNNVDKGGKTAKNEMIQLLKTGLPAAITIDGPKGPIYQVKPGILNVAMNAQVPLRPLVCLSENYWTFNSWDKFRFPKPFTKIITYYGPPVYLPEEMSDQKFKETQESFREMMIEAEKNAFSLFENWSSLSKSHEEAYTKFKKV